MDPKQSPLSIMYSHLLKSLDTSYFREAPIWPTVPLQTRKLRAKEARPHSKAIWFIALGPLSPASDSFPSNRLHVLPSCLFQGPPISRFQSFSKLPLGDTVIGWETDPPKPFSH